MDILRCGRSRSSRDDQRGLDLGRWNGGENVHNSAVYWDCVIYNMDERWECPMIVIEWAMRCGWCSVF